MKKVLLSLLIASPLSMLAQCSELFISEYCEGSGNNKGVEIYNPTPNPVNLAGYVLQRYSNGSAVVSDSLILSGTVAPHDVFVVVNGQTTSSPTSPACDPAMQALADLLDGVYPAPTYFNGDDAMALAHNGVVVDIFGKIGEDPGTAWTDVFPYTDAAGGTWLTANHTLVRHATVTQGVTVNPSEFNTFLEYDTLPSNTWTGLGTHSCSCNTSGIANTDLPTVAIYPNPVLQHQTLTINSSSYITSVEVYTIEGKLLKTIAVDEITKTIQINPAALQVSTCLLKVYSAGKQAYTSKINIR